MTRLENLIYSCPHCLGENPLLGEQRCEHCGMNMHSDNDQRVRAERMGPLSKELDQQLLLLRTRGEDGGSTTYVRKLLKELAPYAATFPGVKPLLEAAETELQEHPEPTKGLDKVLMVNLFVLAILILIPLLGLYISADATVLMLLWVSAIGWSYIGVFRYLQEKKKAGQ
ncbi:MAG: hypothetical protein AB8F95_13730 [Bacteroidia bacterium]